MNRSSALFLALPLLAPLGAAQTRALAPQRVQGPVGKVHYDLATGRVTKIVRPGSPATSARAGRLAGAARSVVRGFQNTLTTGYFTAGNFGSEFIDWAAKHSGAEVTTKIVFGYATPLIDPKFGGEGGALDLALYEGTTGFCTLGEEVPNGRFSFRGLPGIIPTAVESGSYIVTATLAQAVRVPDGPIGWGYGFTDLSIHNTSTGPLLTDFGTNTGWDDAFDFWARDPASTGSCVGTMSFGGCTSGSVPPPPTGTPCASFLLALVEFRPTTPASCAVFAGAGTNPQQLADVSGGPRIGATWETSVDLGAAPAAGASALAATAFGTLAPGIPLGGAFAGTELLIDPRLAGPIDVSLTGLHEIPIPPLPSLDGQPLAAQAAKLVGVHDFPLTNALDCTIGG